MQSLLLGRYDEPVHHELARLASQHVIKRLWDKDATLWSLDPAIQRDIRNRLGWLRITDVMAPRAAEIASFARELQQSGFTHAVLLGMGGSGLFPEVCCKTFGAAPGAIDVSVLDSTDPAAIEAQQRRAPLAKTLAIVSSKSGSTSEIAALSRYFYHALGASGLNAGRHCIAITDQGTSLEAQAKEERYRRSFVHGPDTGADVGGRFSALTYFGLVPAALLGIDIAQLLARAQAMFAQCRPDQPIDANPAAQLGAVLAALANMGRDKLTLLCAPELASFGTWVEQLVAESTGKAGKGIAPFYGEPKLPAASYGRDRVFIELQVASSLDAELDRRVRALADAGQPVVRIHWEDRYDLGGEVAKWELATTITGWLLGINPFDEPNVTESKDRTKALLEQYATEQRLGADETPRCADERLAVYGDIRGLQGAKTVGECLQGWLSSRKAKEYIAVLSFAPRTPALDQAIEGIRQDLATEWQCATTLGIGPRYLHSTGQLYKGGPDAALFLLITADETADLPIPGHPFTFQVLKQAQALGDFAAMRQRGRRVIRVHLRGDATLAVAHLAKALRAAASAVKRPPTSTPVSA